MTMADLLQSILAGCLAAPAKDQGEWIDRAFQAIHWRCRPMGNSISWNPDWLHLQKLLDLGAYEQAALMTLAAGATWRITHAEQANVAVINSGGQRHGAQASTIALAITAAALQAKLAS